MEDDAELSGQTLRRLTLGLERYSKDEMFAAIVSALRARWMINPFEATIL